jgi:putative heme-binding domain-containing protein
LGDIKYKEAGNTLIPLLKDSYSRARFFAAEALGRIEFEPAINSLIELLRANNDEDAYLRHAGSLALARINKPAPIINLSKDPSRAVRIAAVVALRRMNHPALANFLSDADEFIVTEAARAINDDLSIKDALPALGNLLNKTSFKNEALIRRSINANVRVGTDEALQNIMEFARGENNPAKLRVEAIDALSTWAKPSVLDRVDGRYRGVVERDASLVRNKTSESLIQLLNNKDAAVRLSAVKAVSKLKIAQGASPLMALLKTDKEPSVRSEALKALVALNDAQVGDAIKLAIADKDKSVRVTGIDLIAKMNIPKELMVSLLNDVINTKTTEEKQAALLTLGKLPVQYSKNVFDDLLQKMAAKKLPSDIYLELAEAIDSTQSTDLMTKYKQLSNNLSPDTLAAAYAGSMYGGDPDRGRRIFYSNQSAQCIRCHSYNDRGGNAGPRLNGVAARLSRPQILEALINPSARLAPGYGTVTVQLKNGKTVSGILNGENNSGIKIKSGDQKEELIPKNQIAKRTNSPSSMPEMRFILSKKEIRDVVSFLSESKDDQ